jgi:hypothetical protein
MTDKEILDEVYRTCKREPDVGSGEIINMIEREWQRQDDKPLEGWSSEDSMK